jgi:hypothetical protein
VWYDEILNARILEAAFTVTVSSPLVAHFGACTNVPFVALQTESTLAMS